MRKTIKVIILFMAAVLCAGGYKETRAAEATPVAITKENFPDKRVRKEIAKEFDKDKDKVLSDKEIQGAKELCLGTYYGWEYETLNVKGISKLRNITDLTIGTDKIQNISELEKMPQLVNLEISSLYSKIDMLDFSKNINLSELWVYMPIKELKLPNNAKLQILRLQGSRIKKMSIIDFSELKKLVLWSNKFGTITVKNCPKLKKISGTENEKTEKITLNNLPELECLKIGSTKKLKKLNLPDLPSLEILDTGNTQNLKTLNFSFLPELRELDMGSNAIKKFDFKKILNLRTLTVKRNKKITTLDLRPLKKLHELTWQRGKLKKIRFGEKKNLAYMYVQHNQLSGTWRLSKFPKLEDFECSYNKIKNIYARNHKYLDGVVCEHNNLRKIDFYNIEPGHIWFKGNPHVKAYLLHGSGHATYYRFDKSAKVYYKYKD